LPQVEKQPSHQERGFRFTIITVTGHGRYPQWAIVIRDNRMCAVRPGSSAPVIKRDCTTSAETNLLDDGIGDALV
jgi:hypothetical protein